MWSSIYPLSILLTVPLLSLKCFFKLWNYSRINYSTELVWICPIFPLCPLPFQTYNWGWHTALRFPVSLAFYYLKQLFGQYPTDFGVIGGYWLVILLYLYLITYVSRAHGHLFYVLFYNQTAELFIMLFRLLHWFFIVSLHFLCMLEIKPRASSIHRPTELYAHI